MKKKKHLFFTAFLFFIFQFIFLNQSFSQVQTIKGTLIEKGTKKTIAFAKVGVKSINIGTATDVNGEFKLELQPGTYTLVFSSLEYDKLSVDISVKNEIQNQLIFELKAATHQLDEIIVAASKYNQKLEESTSTIEIIKPSIIESKNIISIDKAIEQVPGVAIIDNEPQIRGGSGFSSGLGSRVMILIDEIPMLRPDAGRPVWSFLPVEDVEQIEVVKGASSVIYGSSALNGAINIRTAFPKENSSTKVTIHSGLYSVPEQTYSKTWDGFNPIILGASLIKTKRINNVDLTFGGNFLSDPGYIAGPPNDSTGEYKNGEFQKNFRFNFGTRVRSNHVEGLTYGLNGNFMYSKNTQSYFWMDSDTNIYRSYPGAITNFNEFQFYLDPYIKYFNSKGGTHSLKNRFYYSNNGASNNQSTMSYSLYDEYTFSKTFKKLDNLFFIFGLSNIYAYSFGEVFSGTFNTNGSKTSENASTFIQLEKKFFKFLTISGGARWEYFAIENYKTNKPVFRAGANAKVTKATYVRASWGQGFRFPSIGERYISTFSGNFGIYPNPELKAENSWNAEIGIKQLFKIGKFMGFLDVCGFWQEYQNYIEFNAGYWGTDADIKKNLGYKFLNTADARVTGIDISLIGECKVSDDFSFGLFGGYTYTHPISLDPDKVYYVNPNSVNTVFSYASTSSDTTGNILKYRFEHLGKLDIEVKYKSFALGLGAKYYGFMKNIDKFFYDTDRPGFFQTGIKDYRKVNNNGSFVFDARISYNLSSHFKFALLINNFFNSQYSLRPISIESPRVTSIQLIYKV
ncbi:MAG: TonB-dependent receptor [Bacteroidetes bacterium]|nr:TonB-dependent receptor [Bacteroidota bacterium]